MSNRKSKYRQVVARDGEKCVHCGTTENLTLDHIIPKSRGGSNRVVNLQLLCAPCNLRKGHKVDEALIIESRLVSRSWRPNPEPLPSSLSSRHLPECNGVFCMYGCPVLHGMGARL